MRYCLHRRVFNIQFEPAKIHEAQSEDHLERTMTVEEMRLRCLEAYYINDMQSSTMRNIETERKSRVIITNSMKLNGPTNPELSKRFGTRTMETESIR